MNVKRDAELKVLIDVDNKAKGKGIIFDMDNTLLRSTIDFQRMKTEVFHFLVESGVCPSTLTLNDHTVATLIEHARNSPRLTNELEQSIWDIVTPIEKEGMQGARLENGVREILKQVCTDFHLTVLTNNSQLAAVAVLQQTGIAHFFDYIVGREQMKSIKPAPHGIHYILGHYPDIPASQWLSVGDSWIDGQAAQEVGIPFVAYQGNRKEMESRDVTPVGYISHMQELLIYI